MELGLDAGGRAQTCKCKQSLWQHRDNKWRGCAVNGSTWTHSTASRSRLRQRVSSSSHLSSSSRNQIAKIHVRTMKNIPEHSLTWTVATLEVVKVSDQYVAETTRASQDSLFFDTCIAPYYRVFSPLYQSVPRKKTDFRFLLKLMVFWCLHRIERGQK